MENDNSIKLVFQAKNEKGDGQELVVERVLKVTSSEPSAENAENEGGTVSVVEVARKMLSASLRELDEAGMQMREEHQKVALLKVELAMLTGARQVTLPAVFKDATTTARPETEEA